MDTMPSDCSYKFHVGASDFQIFKFPSLNSTNVYLKSNHLLYPNLSVIFTENQTNGKGRFDRSWQSKAGKGLSFSIKINLNDIPQQHWCNITQLMAYSVALFLEDMGVSSLIRWPNDIIIGNAKICGILGELVQSGDSFTLILGTGININESKEDFSTLDRIATSLTIETGKEMSPSVVLEKILYRFNSVFETFLVSGFKPLVKKLSERLFIPDTPVKVISGEIEYTGYLNGLTDKGTVLLKTDSGIIEVVSGEITSRV